MMNYDADFEINQYIDQEAACYISLKDLLLQHHLTYDEAIQKTAEFREKYYDFLNQYAMKSENIVRLCYDLMAQIKDSPENQDLQFLYFCTVTDTGLLSEYQTGEQAIRNYFQQSEKVRELTDFLQIEFKCKEQLQQVKLHLKKSDSTENHDDSQEFQQLYELTTQHTFLYGAGKNPIYRDNLHSLLIHINQNEILESIKPYLFFAILSRKHGMMQNREHFIPNLQTAFQYQEYQIYTDNGKNFNLYQSYLELYDHLRRFYESDHTTNLSLCDYCFANFSPLSEWYYLYCQSDMDFPMNLKQKVDAAKALSFPMLYQYEDYVDCDIEEFENTHDEIDQIWDMTIDVAMTERFLQLLYQNQDVSEIAGKLPYYEKYPRYAELFLYASGERLLTEQMMQIADILSK